MITEQIKWVMLKRSKLSRDKCEYYSKRFAFSMRYSQLTKFKEALENLHGYTLILKKQEYLSKAICHALHLPLIRMTQANDQKLQQNYLHVTQIASWSCKWWHDGSIWRGEVSGENNFSNFWWIMAKNQAIYSLNGTVSAIIYINWQDLWLSIWSSKRANFLMPIRRWTKISPSCRCKRRNMNGAQQISLAHLGKLKMKGMIDVAYPPEVIQSGRIWKKNL